jgi:hypothetical protein
MFLEVISHFPDIYWMRGKISNLDNLLRAGVNSAEHVIVVKEASVGNEVQLVDCGTILLVQKIHKFVMTLNMHNFAFRMFPKLKLTTELINETNMRFMEFDANDQFALRQSVFEKVRLFDQVKIIMILERATTRLQLIFYVPTTIYVRKRFFCSYA